MFQLLIHVDQKMFVQILKELHQGRVTIFLIHVYQKTVFSKSHIFSSEHHECWYTITSERSLKCRFEEELCFALHRCGQNLLYATCVFFAGKRLREGVF